MAEAPDTVIVIDDDSDVRAALGRLLRSVYLEARLYGSVAEFAAAGRPDAPTCLILDVRLPGQGGLDFQRALSSASIEMSIIFITGHGDIEMSVQAMKSGAIEFLTKPFREQDMLDAIRSGLERDRTRRERAKSIAETRARFSSLTPREREVMDLAVTGRLNKQIAAEIGLSENTVKIHRGNILRKTRAASLVELVLMTEKLKSLPGNS